MAELTRSEGIKLARLRQELFTAAQVLDGEALDEYWQLIADLLDAFPGRVYRQRTCPRCSDTCLCEA